MKVAIRYDDIGRTLQVYMYMDVGGVRKRAKPVVLEFEEVEEAMHREPTMSVTGEFADEFMQAFAEELASHGIKTDNDHKIAGLLEAKNDHLEDMRKLVFNQKFL